MPGSINQLASVNLEVGLQNKFYSVLGPAKREAKDASVNANKTWDDNNTGDEFQYYLQEKLTPLLKANSINQLDVLAKPFIAEFVQQLPVKGGRTRKNSSNKRKSIRRRRSNKKCKSRRRR